MTMESQTRELPPLSLRASFRPATVDAEKRTVELVWTTGARVKRGGFWTEPYWEELSLDPKHVRMGRLNNGAPFLRDHGGMWGASIEDVLAVVESARLAGSEGTAVVRFPRAEDDPDADKVFRKIRDGILQNVSVGYRVYKLVKVEQKDGEIPVMRAEDWEPHEISLVAIGADDGAGVRSAQRSDAAPPPTNPCEFITRGSEPQQKEHKMPEEQQTPQVDVEAERKRGAEAERSRITGIRQAVRAAKLDDSLADELVNGGKTLDAARAVILDTLAKRTDEVNTQPHVRVEVTDDARDKFRRGAEAWLIQKAGVQDIFRKAQAAKVDGFESFEKDAGEFRGLKLTELARMCLERSGVRTAGMGVHDVVGAALTHKRSDAPGWGGINYARDGGFNTTSDFGVLLENILYKTLLGQYAITPDTWSKFCKTDTVQDFRPSNRYRLGSIGVLDSLNEAGEFKNKQIPDGEKHSITADTKGNIIALSRQAIINDDMAALASVAAMLGRAARLSIEVDVYALLALNGGLGPTMTDGQPFFHANRGNVGMGAALTVAGVDADRVVMKSQKDPSGNELLDLKPEILVVPAGLGATARVVNTAVYDPDANNKLQRPNPVVGLYSEIVDTARLSGTRRYSFADPGLAPAIVVAFLEGANMAPYLEQHLGWRVDGTEWKVRLDYKVNIFDWRGAVTNAGA